MILNVQQIWTRYTRYDKRKKERKEEKTDKIYHPDHSVVDRTSNKIQEPFQNRPYTQCTISKRARYDIGGTRPAIVWYGLTFDTTISGGRSTSEIRGTSRCIAFYGAFYSGVVPDHRSSLLPSSLRSVSPPPTLLSIRPAAPSLFAVKEARAAVQGHGRTSSAILSPLHPRYICYTRPLSLAAPS